MGNNLLSTGGDIFTPREIFSYLVIHPFWPNRLARFPVLKIAVCEERGPLRIDGKSDVVSHTGFPLTTGNVFVIVATVVEPVKMMFLIWRWFDRAVFAVFRNGVCPWCRKQIVLFDGWGFDFLFYSVLDGPFLIAEGVLARMQCNWALGWHLTVASLTVEGTHFRLNCSDHTSLWLGASD